MPAPIQVSLVQSHVVSGLKPVGPPVHHLHNHAGKLLWVYLYFSRNADRLFTWPSLFKVPFVLQAADFTF